MPAGGPKPQLTPAGFPAMIEAGGTASAGPVLPFPRKATRMATSSRKPAAKAAKKPARRLCALAAQLYTVRDHLKTTAELDAALRRVAKIGYRFVELCAFPGTDHPTAKALLDKHGLRAIGMHAGYQDWLGKFGEMLAVTRLYGFHHSAIPWIGGEFRGSAANWKKTAKAFTELGRKMAKEGVQLQYHNHHFEFERFDGKMGLDILYSAADKKALKAQLDLAWVARGLQSPAEWILRLKGRVDQLHFKDLAILNTPEGQTRDKLSEIGNGNLDWKAIVAAARKVKAQDLIVEQDADFLGGDPFRSLEASYRFLSRMGLK